MEDSKRLSMRSKEEMLCICFFSMYIYIHMCNLCIELFIYILLLKFAISAILP